MRYGLEYWRQQFHKEIAKNGHWTLQWKNRGQPIRHEISEADVNLYASVPMDEVCNIRGHVLNVYGFLPNGNSSQASYDTGEGILTDGVVPLSDVEQVSNRVGSNRDALHTLRLLPGVGHYYREEGAHSALWAVVKEWLLMPPVAMFQKQKPKPRL
jgi:hypothetical protein